MTSTLSSPTRDVDTAAMEALTERHTTLMDTVAEHAAALLDASSAGDLEGASSARRDLVLYCRAEVLPHAIAEEDSIYERARTLPETTLLVDALIAEHRAITELIDDLAGATTPLGASAAAHALRVLLEVHLEKEATYIVPTLANSTEASLAEAMDAFVAQYDELRAAASGGGCGGGCGCGSGGGGGGCGCGGGGHEAPATSIPVTVAEPAGGGCGCGGGGCGGGSGPAAAEGRPVLDARQVPHHIRHATVFGALDAIGEGGGLELIAPHDPLPLLAQIDERYQGRFEISYLERGPEVWRLALDRTASVDA